MKTKNDELYYANGPLKHHKVTQGCLLI